MSRPRICEVVDACQKELGIFPDDHNRHIKVLGAVIKGNWYLWQAAVYYQGPAGFQKEVVVELY